MSTTSIPDLVPIVNEPIEINYLSECLLDLHVKCPDSTTIVVDRDDVPVDALIVKSLLWVYQKKNPILLVLALSDVVDKNKVANHLQLSGSSAIKQLKMASPDVVLSVTGQTVGNVSPIGHKQPVRTIVDEALLVRYNIDTNSKDKDDIVETGAGAAAGNDVMCYGGGGSTGKELAISLKELLRVSKAEIAPISSVKSERGEQPVASPATIAVSVSATTDDAVSSVAGVGPSAATDEATGNTK